MIPMEPQELDARLTDLVNRAMQGGIHPVLVIGVLEMKQADIIAKVRMSAAIAEAQFGNAAKS